MPITQDSIDEALNQPGGYRQIEYQNSMIIAPMTHVKQAVEMLTESSPERRKFIMDGVRHSLELYPKVLAQLASQEEAMEFCTTVAIWFANEVIEGRRELEEPKPN